MLFLACDCEVDLSPFLIGWGIILWSYAAHLPFFSVWSNPNPDCVLDDNIMVKARPI